MAIEKADNPTKVFDVTIYINQNTETGEVRPSHDHLKHYTQQYCKHWGYARQQGDISETQHWQCRFSYKRKIRLPQLIKDLGSEFGKENVHAEQTEGTDQRDWRKPAYYAYIEDSATLYPEERVYTDKDKGIAEKYDDVIEWYPWQKKVIDMPSKDREVIVIYDKIGGTGKSELAKRLRYESKAVYLPAMHDAKSMVRAITNLKVDGKLRNTIIIDIPRAVESRDLRQLIIAIESIKNGIISEDRYHFDQVEIPTCKVILMCNNLPNPSWLTPDRWDAYEITERINGDLKKINLEEKYKEQQEEIAIQKRDKRRTQTGYQGKHRKGEQKHAGIEKTHDSRIQGQDI